MCYPRRIQTIWVKLASCMRDPRFSERFFKSAGHRAPLIVQTATIASCGAAVSTYRECDTQNLRACLQARVLISLAGTIIIAPSSTTAARLQDRPSDPFYLAFGFCLDPTSECGVLCSTRCRTPNNQAPSTGCFVSS